MFKRRRAGLVVLALAAAAVFVVPASSASAATFPNACINSVTANNSQIDVTMTADAPASVPAGDPVTLSNINQSLAVPGTIFVSGYRIFLYGTGPLTVPATITTVIEGTNTAEGTQATNTVSASISTVINDPTPGNRNSGDETADPGQLDVTYADQTWTAGASGTIDFREDTVTPLVSGSGGIVINALVGGQIPVEFDCSPGTVDTVPPAPPEGIITFDDPAAPFAQTAIQAVEPQRQISISDASATEGGTETFTVSLDAASVNPITVNYATADGSAVAPGDYTAATGPVTFAPGSTSETVTVQTNDDALVEGTETFDVNLSGATGNAAIADGLGVGTILDNDVANQAPTANAGPDQTVASGASVQLDGSGSTDPEDGTNLTYQWTAPAGITLSDPTSATPTFTAPTGPASLTFSLVVCDTEPLCSAADTVTINVNAPPMIDAATDVIVNGPVGPSTRKTSKSFVIKVTNDGTTPITITAGDLTTSVTVDGTARGTVSVAGLPLTLGPGSSKRLKATWNYASGAFAAGQSVAFTACVNLTDPVTGDPVDVDPTDNCDTATVTAK